MRRELFGQRIVKIYKGKSYESCKTGLVEQYGAERIGIASIMIPDRVAGEIETFLLSSGAKVRRFRIWASMA